MKTFFALLVVLAVLAVVGVKFLVSPVMTAYGMCEDAKNQKFDALMTTAEGEDMDKYCTTSQEAIDDMADCLSVVTKTNRMAPYILSYQQGKNGSYGAVATTHMEKCPDYPLGME